MNESNPIEEELFKKILLRCPRCGAQKSINIPLKILTQSDSVVTMGIPNGLICEHSFHAYVDKFFDIRGYQVVDFNISKTEYFRSKPKGKESVDPLTKLPFYDEIINILRNIVDDREIIGSAVFTIKGNVLYSSISHNTLIDTIREFEVRNKEKLHSISKMFLELTNHQKVCSEYLEINDSKVILVLIFSELVNFAIGNMYLKRLVKKIEDITSV